MKKNRIFKVYITSNSLFLSVILHTELDCGTSTGRVHSLHNYHLTTFFRCITLATAVVYLPTISESNAWGFRPVRTGFSENSRRFSEDVPTTRIRESGSVSQAWEIVLDAWDRCLKSAGVRLTYYTGELAGIYANNWLLSSRLVWETLIKKIPEILVGNFRSVRTVCVIYHLPKISGLPRPARLDSSYNMKLVRNSRNL